jgi:hypothetical protein
MQKSQDELVLGQVDPSTLYMPRFVGPDDGQRDMTLKTRTFFSPCLPAVLLPEDMR